MPKQVPTRDILHYILINIYWNIVLQCFFGSKQKSTAEDGAREETPMSRDNLLSLLSIGHHVRVFGSLLSNTTGL